MDEAERAYWTTAAQLVGVFGIALVIEARGAFARGLDRSPVILRLELGGLLLVAMGLLWTAQQTLSSLANNTSDDTSIFASRMALWVAFLVLASNPLISMATAANADLLVRLGARLPWSKHGKARRLVAALRDGTNEFVADTLRNQEAVDNYRKRVKQLREERALSLRLAGEVLSDPDRWEQRAVDAALRIVMDGMYTQKISELESEVRGYSKAVREATKRAEFWIDTLEELEQELVSALDNDAASKRRTLMIAIAEGARETSAELEHAGEALQSFTTKVEARLREVTS